VFAVRNAEAKNAVRALYEEFFETAE
jgi:hypothetical protein